MFIRFVISVLVFTAGVIDATAETRSYRINAVQGQDTRIKWHSTADGQCRQQGFPIYTIQSPPAHGKLSYREERGAIGMPRAWVDFPPHCLGTQILGKAIYYRPDPGFQGRDRVRVQTYFPPGKITIVDIIVISAR